MNTANNNFVDLTAGDMDVFLAQGTYSMNTDEQLQQALRESFASYSPAVPEFKLTDVPSLENLEEEEVKIMNDFNCPICLDTFAEYLTYRFICNHSVCINCAERLCDPKCPECRGNITTEEKNRKRKIQELEQRDMDKAIAASLLTYKESERSVKPALVARPAPIDQDTKISADEDSDDEFIDF